MLTAFVYPNHELLRSIDFTSEQLERARVNLPTSFTQTGEPRIADIFWVPLDLGHIEAYHGGARAVAQALPKLSHWHGNEARHVAYFCSDGADPTGLPCIMFRQSFYKQHKDPNCVAWPYSVEDFGYLYCDDFSQLEYDVSFVGSKVSHKSRIESYNSVADTPGLVSWLDDSKAHWGSIEHTDLGKRRKEIFIQSMQRSVLVLAARGGGLSCYRFFEAMSAGRIPVLFADDWELPHANLIDWGKCIIQIPEAEAKHTGRILLDYLKTASDDELTEMGRECRTAWYQYLAPEQWAKMMERCVRERLGM